MKTLATTLLLFAAALPAQKLDRTIEGGRNLQLHDVQQMLTPKGALTTTLPAGQLAGIAAFARHFATPAFGPADDVQPMGGRYLAVLGSPAQCAFVEQLLQLARDRSDELLTVEVQLFQLPAAVFAQRLQPLFPAGDAEDKQQCILPAAPAAALLTALRQDAAEELSAPKLCVRPLAQASLSTGEQVAYVRDFTVMRQQGKAIADPIVDRVFDGTEVQLLATWMPNGTVGIDCSVQSHKVQRPLPEAKVDLGVGAPVTVQLPRVTTVQLQQKALLPLGDSVVLAAPRQDGSYLCAVVRVSKGQ
jgi:hypothetical protein